MKPEITVEYRVTYDSGDVEFITTSAHTLTGCFAAALKAAKRYNVKTGRRDHVITIEFWARRS